VVEPNGIVPWHSHDDRPAIIYIISGEIYEYSSNCSVPILHQAGEATREGNGTAHWWQNTGKEAVVLLPPTSYTTPTTTTCDGARSQGPARYATLCAANFRFSRPDRHARP